MKKLKHYLDFLWAMTENEIKIRYKNTRVGVLWMIFNPLLQMVIIGFVFSFFVDIPNYFLFLLLGLLPWQFFSFSLSKSTSSFVFQRSLLQKSNFPKEIIPLAIILANFIHLLIALALLIIFLAFTQHLIFINLVIFILSLLWLFIFTIGLSFLTSSLNVQYRDINYLVQALLALWFYATPIIYPLNLIPDRVKWLFSLNPLTAIFETSHQLITPSSGLNLELILSNGLISLGIIILGIITYQKRHPYFVDQL